MGPFGARIGGLSPGIFADTVANCRRTGSHNNDILNQAARGIGLARRRLN